MQDRWPYIQRSGAGHEAHCRGHGRTSHCQGGSQTRTADSRYAPRGRSPNRETAYILGGAVGECRLAVNCWVAPAGIVALPGVTATELITAGVTVIEVEPITEPEVAEIFAE